MLEVKIVYNQVVEISQKSKPYLETSSYFHNSLKNFLNEYNLKQLKNREKEREKNLLD